MLGALEEVISGILNYVGLKPTYMNYRSSNTTFDAHITLPFECTIAKQTTAKQIIAKQESHCILLLRLCDFATKF